MTDLRPGLVELLLTDALQAELADLSPALGVRRSALLDAEAPDRLALHIGRLVAEAVAGFSEKSRTREGVLLARRLVDVLAGHLPNAAAGAPSVAGEVLRAVLRRLPTDALEEIEAPLLPLLDTTLLTNAPGEPSVGHQIKSELASADAVDVIMAFVRTTGVNPLLPALRAHTAAGRPIRLLTTIYTGSTQAAALEALAEAGVDVRVSYDTTTTRLHAKAWLFHRRQGFSTAYVGSSNLTHSAQVSGVEWNVRASGARNPTVIEKIQAVFDSYWEGGDFRPYEPAEFAAHTEQRGSKVSLPHAELYPQPFQARLLEQVAAHRARGHHRNLIVSATGTGKTVMAALDYASQCHGSRRPRLLFVAHRRELLDQSLNVFRHALREPAFGELWVGGLRPTAFQHVFASIQTLDRAALERLPADHFDVVIVDEFHHAAARSYRDLLAWVQPRELLGLTATPERADGLSVLDVFDGRIAAELRLWDAIDQQHLCPFQYYGLSDGTDLRRVPFKRGQGYDVAGLTNVYTANDATARLVLQRLREHVDDLSEIRALGFCVSVEHARFMARVFNDLGIRAAAVWGDTPDVERESALRRLKDGEIQVLFSVDLFNEGVDVPTVDTLLLLRPTESPTLFLQQLGRGLRKARDKSSCVVLDFVGHHRQEFRFDRRLAGLLPGGRRDIERQVEQGFPVLPAGCSMQLDAVARAVVLRSLREALPTAQAGRVEELRRIASARGEVSLATFLEQSGLVAEDVYTGDHTWSELRQAAGLTVAASGPHELLLRRAVTRLLHVDDEERVTVLQRLLAQPAPPVGLDVRERRVMRMLLASLFADRGVSSGLTRSGAEAILWQHPQIRADLIELLGVLEARRDHVQHRLATDAGVPLWVHARYTRLELLSAFGDPDGLQTPAWREGVKWLPDAAADLFVLTLDKSGGGFSPTTRYRDYAIRRDLVHWESQSTTSSDSPTGRRYREHVARGTTVHLCCRVSPTDRAFWYLGPATYVRHEGERPMAVTWKLHHALPGDLFASFAAAVA